MKDKIKARYEQLKRDPFAQGMFLGGVIGVASFTATAIVLKANFDGDGLYIPDTLIEAIKDDGFAVARKNDARIVLAMVPEV